MRTQGKTTQAWAAKLGLICIDWLEVQEWKKNTDDIEAFTSWAEESVRSNDIKHCITQEVRGKFVSCNLTLLNISRPLICLVVF